MDEVRLNWQNLGISRIGQLALHHPDETCYIRYMTYTLYNL